MSSLKNLSAADQVNLKRTVHCTSVAINHKPKSNIWYKAQRMGQGKIGKIVQSIAEGTSVEECNKRVAGHVPRKTLVRKLDQLGYSRDEISAVNK